MRYCNAMRPAAVAVAVLLATIGVNAQRRHGNPPPAPAAPQALPPPSPFAARPDTYAPHYDSVTPRQSRRGSDYAGPLYGGFDLDSLPPALTPASPSAPDQGTSQSPVPERSKIVEPSVESARIAMARGPDTFYVIPGCYAGNRPPIPERLPKGCDVARLRTTPIR